MTNNNLSVANFVRINVNSVPQGADLPNVNSLALFTTEKPANPLTVYGIYLDPTSVANDYGTDSETYAMALEIFSQNFNPLNGGGRLVILPYIDAVSADEGDFITANISANLAALTAVDDGDLTVTLNGIDIDLTNLNFTSCTTLVQIAGVLQGYLPDAIVSASATAITVASKTVGTASTVVLTAFAGTGTDLSGAGLLNTATGSSNAGRNADGETLAEAIVRTQAQVQYAGIITNLEMEEAVIEDNADAIQALDLLWVHSITSTSDIAGIATTLKDAGDSKTRLFLYTISIADAKLARAAYAGRGFSVDFAASNSMITMNAKNLATISPDSGLTQTILADAELAGVDVYGKFGGLTLLYTSGENGGFFDELYSNLWLKFALQTVLLNAQVRTNTKLPQTEAGMQQLVNDTTKLFNQAVSNGVLGLGLTWNSPSVFGNPADLKRNITDTGFYIYYIPIAQQSQIDREGRIAPTLQFAAKRSGAIQHVNGNVIIEA